MLSPGLRPSGARAGRISQDFLLHPGEQIHYTVCERPKGNQTHCPDAEFSTKNPEVLRLIKPTGLFEAQRPGRTELVARTATSERRVTIRVAGRTVTPMKAVPHNTMREIVAKDLLFVGHANLDGFDHTAVAKPGIDRLVQEARKNGWTVVYWVSQEYPDWYTPIDILTTRSSAKDKSIKSVWRLSALYSPAEASCFVSPGTRR